MENYCIKDHDWKLIFKGQVARTPSLILGRETYLFHRHCGKKMKRYKWLRIYSTRILNPTKQSFKLN